MALLNSPICDREKVMPSFELVNIDGKILKSTDLWASQNINNSFVITVLLKIINKIVETTNNWKSLIFNQ